MGEGGCDCSKYIYWWVYLFKIYVWVGVGGCDCLKHICGWVYHSRRHFWVDVTVYSIFKGGCTFLEHVHQWVWLFRAFSLASVAGCDLMRLSVVGYDWVWLGVTGCWLVGKMVKPVHSRFKKFFSLFWPDHSSQLNFIFYKEYLVWLYKPAFQWSNCVQNWKIIFLKNAIMTSPLICKLGFTEFI